MKIKWLGHAAFLITSDAGTTILTDPYTPNDTLRYKDITESADIVTVSHDHFDHGNVKAVKGNPVVIREAGEAKGIKFETISVFHDESGGGERGSNTIFCFEVDCIRICHLGDLGHKLSDSQLAALGKVDILMIPVGGFYTIDAKTATEIAAQIEPKIILPMHFRNDRCPDFPVAGVDDFIRGKENVTKLEVSEVEFKEGVLPAVAQIVVMEPAK